MAETTVRRFSSKLVLLKGKQLCWSLFLIKLQAFIWLLWSFLKNICERLLLDYMNTWWCPYCVKSFQIRSFFWSVFSHVWTEYREILRISPYSVRIKKNKVQKKLRIWTLFTQCFILCGFSEGCWWETVFVWYFLDKDLQVKEQ